MLPSSHLQKLKGIQANSSFWLGLSLLIPCYFGLSVICFALTQNYVIQDDARQHVVWLQRFINPQLFAHDLIARYYPSLQPVGYKSLFELMAQLGIEPLLLAKILPIVLALITTFYSFKFSLQILPIPASAFLSALILNQNFWLKDDISSASPRSFLYPIFAAFLYFLSKRSLIPCLLTIALQGLFFPQLVLLQAAILTVRLLRWHSWLPKFSKDKQDYLFWLSGLAIAVLVLLPFVLETSEFGAVITAAQMKQMPEYGLHGRNEYFGVNPLKFIFGGSSGLRAPLLPLIIWLSVSLPFLLRSKLPVVQQITAEVRILAEVLFASLGMFLLAHLMLFKLYYPSRYTYHSLRFVMAIAAGISLFMVIKAGWQWLQQKRQSKAVWSQRELMIKKLIQSFAVISIAVPAIPFLFLNSQGWRTGQAPEIYQFLAAQPQDILIASLAEEADNIPAFSQRSVLIAREFALPYHLTYYRQFSQRTIDILRAQYSSDLTAAKQAIQTYGIDFFLLDRTAFEPGYLLNKDWLINSVFKAIVLEVNHQLIQGKTPAFANLESQCASLSTTDLILLNASCILTAELQ